jgi:hypothetical protein
MIISAYKVKQNAKRGLSNAPVQARRPAPERVEYKAVGLIRYGNLSKSAEP